jgi:hypothetical protein
MVLLADENEGYQALSASPMASRMIPKWRQPR